MQSNKIERKPKEHWGHIDIAKGIGIIFVVFGHNWIVQHKCGEIYRIIYSFHMPLFFFLSGIFFNANVNYMNLLIKKTDRLLKPYYTFLLTFGILKVILNQKELTGNLIGIVYGSGCTLPLSALWFLTHLWIVFVTFWFIVRYTNILNSNYTKKILFLLLILLLGWLTQKAWNEFGYHSLRFPFSSITFRNPGLPFSFDVVLLTGFYFLGGLIFSEPVKNFIIKKWVVIVVLSVFIFFHYAYDYSLNFNRREYSHLLISSIQAIAGIYLILSISKLLLSTTFLNYQLTRIGKISFYIYIFHGSIQSISFEILNIVTAFSEPANAMLSFFISIIGSICFSQIIQRVSFLRYFFLPRIKE